ncbi:hypothetical protein SUNI508_09199 [Seiridium unicorne]|uniref:Uncharacterized protein n=1 Tax=Seiridium unicorne TaxID=138068 RepID=A0ABR2UQL1_9PEZI
MRRPTRRAIDNSLTNPGLGQMSLTACHDSTLPNLPDINATTRFLVYLGIARCPAPTRSTGVHMRKLGSLSRSQYHRTSARLHRREEGNPSDSLAYRSRQDSSTKIEGQYRFVAGCRELERKDFDLEFTRFKGLEASDVTKSSTTNPARSFESVMDDDDVATEKFGSAFSANGEHDSGSGHGKDGNHDEN